MDHAVPILAIVSVWLATRSWFIVLMIAPELEKRLGGEVRLADAAYRGDGILVLEDLTLLTTAVLVLSPKLHCGYFCIPVLTMAPLVRRYRLAPFYFLCSTLALTADMYKWPVEDFDVAFGLMVAAFLVLIGAMVWVRWKGGWSAAPGSENAELAGTQA